MSRIAHRSRFLNLMVDGRLPDDLQSTLTKRDYLERAAAGGFPEARNRPARRRAAWFAVFLIARIPAWSPNLTQREIRAPKVFVTDPGLASHLRDLDIDLALRPELAAGSDGPVIEGFVAMEFARQAAWSDLRPRLSHYRDRDAGEIDLIVEAQGRVAAVEVKAGSGADRSALRTLSRLRDRIGERFSVGVVLHTGPQASRLGDRLYSLPISALVGAVDRTRRRGG